MVDEKEGWREGGGGREKREEMEDDKHFLTKKLGQNRTETCKEHFYFGFRITDLKLKKKM